MMLVLSENALNSLLFCINTPQVPVGRGQLLVYNG